MKFNNLLDKSLLAMPAEPGGQPKIDQLTAAIKEYINTTQDSGLGSKTSALIEDFNQSLLASQGQAIQTTNTPQAPDDAHFLNRLGYGSNPELSAQLNDIGWQEMLEQQLDYESIDTSALDATLVEDFPTLTMTPLEILEEVRDGNNDLFGQVPTELIVSTILRQTFSPAQLYERMVEFWSDHFNMNVRDDPVYFFKPTDDRDNIRPHAMGKFKDLLRANASSTSMLFYLDNYSNTKYGPNENYARELLELHSLGVDGGYTEDDIVVVARAFTGWTIHPETLEFVFYMPYHDRRKKEVMGVKLKKTYNGGITDGEQIIDMLAAHPSTARFVSTKLARRFVSDTPPAGLVDELTQVFLDTEGDTKELLRTIFYSDAFWNSREEKMKRPVDFFNSLVRRVGFNPDENLFRYVFFRLAQLSQIPFFWHAPDGYPDTADYWTNTAAMISRWSSSNDISPFIPLTTLDSMLAGANTPNSIIQAMAVGLIDRKLGKEDRRELKRKIFAGQKPNQPVDGDPVQYARIVATVLLGSRYFQMR